MIIDWRSKIAAVPPHYRPSTRRFWFANSLYGLSAFGIGWLFFESWAVSAMSGGLGLWIGTNQLDRYVRREKQLVSAQFEQMLYALASSLQAGRSVENAFRAVEADMKQMYSGSRPILLVELESVNRKVENGSPIEKAVQEMNRALAIGEVNSWSDMFVTCKRTGGDLIRVMRHTSRAVVEKMNMERELSVLIAGKRFEARALSILPFLIIGVFRYGSPEYMEPLYGGAGRLVMAAALLLLLFGIGLADRFMQMEV